MLVIDSIDKVLEEIKYSKEFDFEDFECLINSLEFIKKEALKVIEYKDKAVDKVEILKKTLNTLIDEL